MQKKLKLSSDSGDSSSKNCKRGYGGVCQSVFGGSLESGSQFCFGAFDMNLASVASKMFAHLIYFIKKYYKFCTFNAICKDIAAINCITVQYKKGLFPSTLTGHNKLVF
jgi:hypothetical protein